MPQRFNRVQEPTWKLTYVCVEKGLSDGFERAQSRPVFFMYLFGPAPETALSDYRLTLIPEIVMKEDRILPAFVYHKRHPVIVSDFWRSSFDFGRDVGRRDFALERGHVGHLRPRKAYGIADGVKSLRMRRAHIVVNANVAL